MLILAASEAGATAQQSAGVNAPGSPVPGVIINHSPAASGLYIGSPGLAVWTNGNYLASHDFFGPKSQEFEVATSLIFSSPDRGETWRQVARVRGAFWSSLFVHRGVAYLMGTDKHHGRIVIRRSVDGGNTWTEPRDTSSGVLADGQFHTAPMPVLEHAGRLWRTFEDASGGTKWGERYKAGMLSVSVDADLLCASNWSFSNFLPSDRAWNNNDMGAWLEGNAVLGRNGRVLNILRVDTKGLPELAAVVSLSPDGKLADFNPPTGFVMFPGGAKKFTIRFDAKSDRYWTLSTVVTNLPLKAKPAGVRNTLALCSSGDLKRWLVHKVLLHHPDVAKHGFQYVDWLFDQEDIIAACRTAFDDDQGGARNNHDANYLTFHRIHGFRALQRETVSFDRLKQSTASGTSN